MFGAGSNVSTTGVTEAISDALPYSPPPTVVRLILAFLVLLVGWYVSKVVVRLAGRTVARRIERPSLTRSALRGIRASVLVVALVIAGLLLEVGAPTILLSVTVISAVVAIVLAPLVGSLINGLFVLADRPFEIGDMIEVTDEGHRGFVEDITIRYTKIFTLENTFIVVPNSEIHARDVINYSAEDERTRLDVRFEVTYESDLEEARRLAERAARSVDDVIAGGPDIRIGSARYPAAPTCHVDGYAEDGVALVCRFWAKHPYKLAAVRSAVQERIWERYEGAPVEFAYPHRHHVFDDTSGVARVRTATGPANSSSRPGSRATVDGGADDHDADGPGGRSEDDADPTGTESENV